jgi:hypothetical protein
MKMNFNFIVIITIMPVSACELCHSFVYLFFGVAGAMTAHAEPVFTTR